jgi:beta-glucosidase
MSHIFEVCFYICRFAGFNLPMVHEAGWYSWVHPPTRILPAHLVGIHARLATGLTSLAMKQFTACLGLRRAAAGTNLQNVICSHAGSKDGARTRSMFLVWHGLLLLFMLFGITGPSLSAQGVVTPSNPQLVTPAINRQVETLLNKMTLDEKIGQLTLFSVGRLDGPALSHGGIKELIAHGEVGAIAGAVSAEQADDMQRTAIQETRLHIPLLSGTDIDHGDRTIFPMPLALASSFDPSMVERLASLAAAESRADGIDWTYSPMVDIARDARWGRIVEGSGEDVLLSSTMAAAYVRGYQGKSLSDPQSIAACVKHFAAYGASMGGRDYNEVDMSDWTLRRVYLPSYEAAIKAGAPCVMVSFNSLNGVPMTANRYLLRNVLRGEWGFDGLVMSDWGAVQELMVHGIAANDEDAAALAMRAGVDMDNNGNIYHLALKKLVENGTVSPALLNEAVRNVLRVKFAMGLFQHPYTATAPAYVATPEKRKMVREAAEETFVLLKNDPRADGSPLLPLRRTKRIALIGPLADSQTDMFGSWQGNGNPKDVVTLRAALDSRLTASGDKLLYVQGTDISGQSDAGFAAALQAARESDVVVMALGENGPFMSGEAASRAHIDLPGNQEQLLEAVVAVGKPVVLVLFNGRPLALPWVAEHVPAILDAWFPGIEAGPAIVATLFGESNPSGKLPVSFPYAVGQEPLSYVAFPTGRPPIGVDYSHYRTSEKYLSRYIDERNTALFPFGWGLSYTKFTYGKPTVQMAEISAQDLKQTGQKTVDVRVPVKNDGPVAGSEIVQLYLHRRVASVEEPMRELKAFQRITLRPGEQRTVGFRLGFKELSMLNHDLKTVIEPGLMDIYVGGDSLASHAASFKIDQ